MTKTRRYKTINVNAKFTGAVPIVFSEGDEGDLTPDIMFVRNVL